MASRRDHQPRHEADEESEPLNSSHHPASAASALSASSASYSSSSSSKRHPIANGYTSSSTNSSSASWQRHEDGGMEDDNPESRRGQIIGSSRFLSTLRASASSDAASVLPTSLQPPAASVLSSSLHSTAPPSSAAVFSPPSASKVPGLLKALIVDITTQEQRRLHRSASLSAAQVDSLRSYCLRLLSSRLAAPRAAASSTPLLQLVDLVQHEVAASGSGDAVYAAELLQRFVRREGLREKAAVLQLLYACRQRSAQQSHRHVFFLPVTAPAFPLSSTPALQRIDNEDSELRARRFRDEQEEDGDDGSRRQLAVNRDVSRARRLPVTGGGRERPADSVPDSELMRDILFAFQGVDGQLLRFDSPSLSYRLSAAASQLIPAPRQRLLSRICQLGALYRLICTYVNKAMERGSVADRRRQQQQQHRLTAAAHPQPESLKAAGLIEQSFVGAVQSELSDYLRWVAVMESRLLQSPDSLTLHRLYVASQPPLSRLVLLASLTSSASASHGGALLTALYAHYHHGSPAVQSLVRRVLSASCAPLVLLIQRWIGQGEIHDPHLEFFIAVEQSVPAARLWSDRYRLRRSMLPAFISLQLAQQILVIGKSVNFIRECCHDSSWEAHTKLDLAALFAAPDTAAATAGIASASSVSSSPSSASSSSLLRDVSQCAALTNAQLLSLLLHRYHFLLHARALKSYLLLSAGDFIQSLLSLLQSELQKPASAVNSRHLLSLVDQAVRASNARFDSPDVLRRLSVKLLRAQDAGGDTGWDVFSLDYSLDAPLSIVLTPASLAVYLRLFSFLFRLKRVEWEISAVWMRQSTHRFVIDKTLGGLPVYDGLRRVLRVGHALRQEMSHLLLNVSSYLMLQVMETSWETFEKEVKAAKEMDDLIRCHAAYVQAIADKALLSGVAAPLSALLLPLFDDCLRFTRMQATLYDEALNEVAKRQTYSLQANKQQQQQQYSASADSSRRPSVDDTRARAVSAADAYAATAGALLDSGVFVSELPRWEEELQRLTTRFHHHLYTFLNALDACIEKGQSSNGGRQQQTQHTASAASSSASSASSTPQPLDDHADASPLLSHAPAAAADDEQRGVLPSLSSSSSSSSYLAELEFLRLRLDFNDFYSLRKAQHSVVVAAAQQSAGALTAERADAATTGSRAATDGTKRAAAVMRSSGAPVAMGGSVAASRAASKSVPSNGDAAGGLPPRPRAAAARRAQHRSDDDSSGRE